MPYDQKLKEKARKILEAMEKWKEAVAKSQMEEIKKHSLEIEELGKDLMKSVFKDVYPGETLSSLVRKVLEEDQISG